MSYWGYHLIVDAGNCDLTKITDGANITAFAKDLVKRIDMVAFGEPQVVNFGTEDKAGYTLVQLIETSNICAHFANSTKATYLDVFSCKPFDIETVKKCVEDYFNPESMRVYYLTRQA
jgi:S-adenosylmethionine/arginine decarboxylase-like enzyme